MRHLLALAAGVIIGIGAVTIGDYRPVPSCAEDSVVVGFGDYDGGTGRWAGYRCGPAFDDIVESHGGIVVGPVR